MTRPEYFDTRDDRWHTYKILRDHLNSQLRCEFLEWCCRNANTSLRDVLRPGKESRFTPDEVFWQLQSLAFMHGLDLKMALNKLEDVARRQVC